MTLFAGTRMKIVVSMLVATGSQQVQVTVPAMMMLSQVSE